MNNDNKIKINAKNQKCYYPITLNLQDKLCVVIGCGNIGERKILSLLEYGAEVKVVSKKISDKIKNIAGLPDYSIKLKYFEKSFDESDLKGSFLVYCATENSELNMQVFKAASAAGALVNIVDVPELCNFIVPSVLKRGRLSIAVSTSGAAPAFSKKLRHELESLISDKYEEYIEFLAVKRLLIKDTVKDSKIRQKIFKTLIDSNLLECFASEDLDAAEKIFNQIMSKTLSYDTI